MKVFKLKYNYLIFGLRLLSFIFFLTLFFGLIFIVAPKTLQSNNLNFKIFIGLLAGLFLAAFFIYRFAKLLLTQRNILTFVDGQLKRSDAIIKKESIINVEDIKGFSLTRYPTRVWNFKEIIIYLNSGEKIELPQFLYWNFSDIKKKLESNGLVFLGGEPFRWRFPDRRYYKFEGE